MAIKDDILLRIDVTKLYPRFLEKIRELEQNLVKKGQIFVATTGYRSPEEQDAIYAIGRTKPGGKKTNAKAWFSPHQYGIAIDFAYDLNKGVSNKLNPSWDDKYLKILADEATAVGLESGFNWKSLKDGPHIQLPIKKYGITWDQLRSIGQKGGLEAVWAFLDLKIK